MVSGTNKLGGLQERRMSDLSQECVEGVGPGCPDPAQAEVRPGQEGVGGVGHEELSLPIFPEVRFQGQNY